MSYANFKHLIILVLKWERLNYNEANQEFRQSQGNPGLLSHSHRISRGSVVHTHTHTHTHRHTKYMLSPCRSLYLYLTSTVPSGFVSSPHFLSIVLLSSATVSEPVRLLAPVPLRDGSKRFHREEHQEELPRHAPVHGEVSSNWCCGRTSNSQNRVRKHCGCICVCSPSNIISTDQYLCIHLCL